ncbi:hypothetical protein O9929_13295 [Vibrio lentus]|nr:hypothetical protein [Vibrio lentus]
MSFAKLPTKSCSLLHGLCGHREPHHTGAVSPKLAKMFSRRTLWACASHFPILSGAVLVCCVLRQTKHSVDFNGGCVPTNRYCLFWVLNA